MRGRLTRSTDAGQADRGLTHRHRCTEPVTPSSGFPTDLRLTPAASRRAIDLGRSVLGAVATLRVGTCPVKATTSTTFRNFARSSRPAVWGTELCRSGNAKAGPCVGVRVASAKRTEALRAIGIRASGFQSWRKTKCTEPVTPSSRSPTDRRRSDCRSENLQPRALRTRCKPQSRDPRKGRQDPENRTCRKLRCFLYTKVALRSSLLALDGSEREKGPSPKARPKNSPSR